MKSRRTSDFWIGLILLAVGLYFLFQHAYVFSFSLFSGSRFNPTGVCIILGIVFVVAYVVKPMKIWLYAAGLTLLVCIGYCLWNISGGLFHMKISDLVISIGLMAVGLGLIIRDFVR